MSERDDFTKVRLERREDGVRVLMLTDPSKRNAIGPQMRSELIAVSRQFADDDGARALVVAGAGTAFCAGADLGAIFDVEGASPATIRARELSYYESFLWIRDLPYPTVAAVDGPAIGAGLNLALACDIVIAGADARFGATFAKLGLHPGGGCTYFLTQAMGPRRALATLLLGRTLDAETAVAHGLAERVADDSLADALEFASRIAALEPSFARDLKQAVRLAATGSFESVIAFESWAQAGTAFNPGVIEGIRAAGRSTRS